MICVRLSDQVNSEFMSLTRARKYVASGNKGVDDWNRERDIAVKSMSMADDSSSDHMRRGQTMIGVSRRFRDQQGAGALSLPSGMSRVLGLIFCYTPESDMDSKAQGG